jgi:hypothetical protein
MTSKREVSSRLRKVTSSQLVHALTTGDFKQAFKVLMVERASTSLACIVGHDLQAPRKVGLTLSSSYSVLRASSLAKVEV